ncbi:PhoI [Thermococcus sp. SY098]|uniref:PhoI n=1 Tax=Thermococcus sp. SY098 TaxID=3111325 RepID=UPI002D765C71|nr:PhoI [Thermococcus sp. SY098]WRS53658.1 PhoI [Thermococcus sp. SY098]
MKMGWHELGSYELESFQVFFPASLEIQEELLKAGFKVPYDKEKGFATPIPVVAAFKTGRKLRKDKLLKGRKIKENGNFAEISPERALLKLLINEKGFLKLEFEVKNYHLEDLGFVRVPPRIWSTWASFSLPIDAFGNITEKLGGFANERPKGMYFASKSNGKEIEVYSYKGRKAKNLGIPVFGYNMSLESFELVKEYLNEKAEKNRVNEEVLQYLKLGLKKRTETKAGLKVGIVWREGKAERVTLKLSTTYPKIKIIGLYGKLEGKSRGELSNEKDHFIIVHSNDFYWALLNAKNAFGF